jgi:hypothetical protein
MKKKYEKPEMIIEVMSIDMLQMACTHGGHANIRKSATSIACACCLSPNWAIKSTF